MAKQCNFSTKKNHHQVPLDAKGKVIRGQVSTIMYPYSSREGSKTEWAESAPPSDSFEGSFEESFEESFDKSYKAQRRRRK